MNIDLRVRDNVEQKMIYNAPRSEDMYWPNDYVMLWTWLKDKKWKKIYDGDLIYNKRLKITKSKSGFDPERPYVKDWSYTVWKEVCRATKANWTGFNLTRAFADNAEIKGNIYETPELLKNIK